jgi:outer membrane lipoprotein carrier protein
MNHRRRSGLAFCTIVIAWTALLFSTRPFAATDDNAAGQQRVEKFLSSLEGFQAEFRQVLTDRAGQILDESSGSLAIRRPNRFRWEYKEPFEQVIVADGARIWLYDSDLEQVTVRKLDQSLSATPAMLLSGQGKLEDNFKVTQTSSQAGVQWVRMEPRRTDTDFRWVRLGFAGDVLKFMELADKLSQTTMLEFSQFERNPPMDPARFTFVVPPGADVIGDASNTEPQPQKP